MSWGNAQSREKWSGVPEHCFNRGTTWERKQEKHEGSSGQSEYFSLIKVAPVSYWDVVSVSLFHHKLVKAKYVLSSQNIQIANQLFHMHCSIYANVILFQIDAAVLHVFTRKCANVCAATPITQSKGDHQCVQSCSTLEFSFPYAIIV